MSSEKVAERVRNKLTRAKAEHIIATNAPEALRGRHELTNHQNKHVRAKLAYKLTHG